MKNPSQDSASADSTWRCTNEREDEPQPKQINYYKDSHMDQKLSKPGGCALGPPLQSLCFFSQPLCFPSQSPCFSSQPPCFSSQLLCFPSQSPFFPRRLLCFPRNQNLPNQGLCPLKPPQDCCASLANRCAFLANCHASLADCRAPLF